MNGTTQTRSIGTANIANVVLGIWVIVSPWVLGFYGLEAAKWNDVAVGGAVTLLALGRRPPVRAYSLLNILLGAWLIASPFVLGFTAPTPLWNSIVLGALILLLAWAATSEQTSPAPPPPAP